MKESTKQAREMCKAYEAAAARSYHTAWKRHFGDDVKIAQAARAIIENARRSVVEDVLPICETKAAEDYCKTALHCIDFYLDSYQKKGLI